MGSIPILERIDTPKDYIQGMIIVPTRELALKNAVAEAPGLVSSLKIQKLLFLQTSKL